MKILVLSVPEMSHVKAFLHVYDILVDNNHEVTLYTGESQARFIQNKNINIKYYNKFFIDNIYHFNKGLRGEIGVLCKDIQFTEDDIKIIADQFRASYLFRIRCMKKYLQMIDEDFSGFDLVFYDYYLYFGEYISSTYQIPSVSLMPTLLPITGVRDVYLYSFINNTYLLNIFTIPPDSKQLIQVIDEMSTKISKSSKHNFDFFINGISQYNLICSSRMLYPYNIDENSSRKVFFIGRRKDDVRVETDKKKNYILVYLGHINDEVEAAILSYLIVILRQTSLQATVAVSNLIEWNPEIFESKTDNVCLDDNVDFTSVMSETSLYICHGGMGGIQEALLNEVPILCIPTSGERYENAKRLEELGAGLWLKPDMKELEDKLLEFIYLLLSDNSYRKNVKKIAESYEEDVINTNNIIKMIIEEIVKGK